jgi:hypothetical protein
VLENKRIELETGSCSFLKLVLENKRIGILYRLEPDLQGVGASSSWCLEKKGLVSP